MSGQVRKRKYSRREFLRGAAAATAGLALAACATPAPEPTEPPEAKEVPTPTEAPVLTEPVTIVWWRSLSGAVAEALEDMAKRFSEAHDLIDIQVEFQGGYQEAADKLTASVAAGQVPDMMLMGDGYWQPYGRSGVLEPLDELINGPTGIDLDDYLPVADRGLLDGKWYQLPVAVSTPLFYYNVEMIEAAGLKRPVSEEWTWDEHFDEYIPKTTIKEGDQTKVHGHAYRTKIWWQQCYCWAYGGQLSDDDYNVYLDSPEVIDLWTRLQNANKNGQLHIATSAEGGTFGYFNSQLCATLWASTGSLERMAEVVQDGFEWDVAGIPQGPQGRFVATGGSGLVLMSGRSPENRHAAWEFIRWTQEPEQVVFFAQSTGYMAHTKSAMGLMTDFLAERPKFQIAYDAMACCARRTDSVVQDARAAALVYDTLDNLVISDDDVVETLTNLQKEVKTILIEDGLLKG